MNRQYISDEKGLAACIDFLSKVEAFAIDLEFDKNRYRYGFNMCLMQLYAEDHCFIVDPLSEELTIETIFPLIENPAIQKVVFSFGEDLRLFHSMGCFPQNTFDIAIALRLLDYPPSSLGNALYDIMEIEVGKSAQKSNWFSRPLSEKQIAYAASDVLYLIDMKEILVKDAETAGIMDWIEEENAFFDTVSYADVDNNNYLKEKDKKDLTEHEFYIFKGLLEFRETLAEGLNRPSYQVIDKEYLKELAERPNQIHRFGKIKGLHRSLKNDTFKDELWAKREALERAADLDDTISRNEKAMKRLSSEEYYIRKKERSKRDEIKKKVFKPIQKLIAERQGENVVTYILGNRLMDELSAGNTENLRDYKRALFEKYAAELNLDVSPYFSE